MSVIRSTSCQKKIFCTIFHAVHSTRNVSSCFQRLMIPKMTFLPLRLCSSLSPNAAVDTKYCGVCNKPEKTSKHLESLHYTLGENFILEKLEKPDLELIAERFGLQGLSIRCINKYNVRVSPDLTTLLFPFHSLDKEVSAIQTMVFNKNNSDQNVSMHLSTGSENPVLFGWPLVNPTDKVLVITSDPLDAIAVNQIADVATVSLPHNFSTFSSEVLAVLKDFKKVVFWLTPHLHNWELIKMLEIALKEIGYFICPDEYKYPLFCLQNGSHIKQIIKDAYPLYDKCLESFHSLKDKIYKEINEENISGFKWDRFSPLNDLLKGLRKGEVTVFSGHTGTGKTTFLSEYSLDLCIQGIPTLWANFEISNSRLMKTMLCQYSMCSLNEVGQDYDIGDKFQKIPMSIINFQDCYSLEGILSAMVKSIRKHKVQHIVIDNLQFMMNMDDYNSSIDQLRRQDQIFSAFREFASHWNRHITIVIHPRKEPQFSELNITSISGTAKATQEADNIIFLQTTNSRQYLEVAKNRFDGHRGCINLEFDRRTLSYTMKKINTKVKIPEKQSLIL